jgi:hypothetical protein
MKFIYLTIFALLALPAVSFGQQTKYDRLPPDITLETEVRKDVLNRRGKVVSSEITTVGKRLKELKARYRKNLLVDGKGREIRFFEPLCRGVSAGYEEDERVRKEKDRELAALKKKFTVIVLYCNPLKAV